MMNLLVLAIAAFIYPGVLTALAAGAIFGLLGARRQKRAPLGGALGTQEGLAAIAAALLAGLALGTLPWPLHPAPGGAAWLWAWAGFELAFLLPLLPPLLAGAPAVVRAAIREAQLGALARAALWAALGAALAAHGDWRPSAAPAHLLALAVALAALPAALGWGPFGAEESVTPEGSQAGLPPGARALDGWSRNVRAGALIAAALVATLPVAVATPWLGVAMVGAGLLAASLALRRIDGRVPRMTLPRALRLYTFWGLPLAALAAAALALAGRI
jgi:hypothetical protein